MKARILILLILCGGLLQGQTHRPSVTAGRLTGNNTENNWTLGRLGIGTTSPLKPLHLVGVGYVNGSIGIGTSTPAVGLVVHDDIISLTNTGTASALRFYEPSGSGINYTAFKAQTQAGDVTYTLPAADGSNGQALQTDGSGTLSWSGYPADDKIYSFNVLLDATAVNGLGTAYTLVAAPSAGYSIEVISCSMSMTVSVQLEVGSQTLNLWVNQVAAPQYLWSNGVVEQSASIATKGVAQGTAYHKSATALSLQFSAGTNPVSGSVTIRVTGIYRIVQL